jgi:hypothetical protein
MHATAVVDKPSKQALFNDVPALDNFVHDTKALSFLAQPVSTKTV